MTNSEDNNFSNKDLYQHLWEGRNFELSHFWHRSVFLTGIFVVLLAGYGKVIFAMYFPESGDADITAMHHFIAWGITLLCLVFSMLWIMMSKGSKYCYERYEYSLNALLSIFFKLLGIFTLPNLTHSLNASIPILTTFFDITILVRFVQLEKA